MTELQTSGFCSLPVTIMVYSHHGEQMRDKHSALFVLDPVCTYCASRGFTKINSHLHNCISSTYTSTLTSLSAILGLFSFSLQWSHKCLYTAHTHKQTQAHHLHWRCNPQLKTSHPVISTLTINLAYNRLMEVLTLPVWDTPAQRLRVDLWVNKT